MECLNPVVVTHSGVRHKVPCGKCAFCGQSRRSAWAFRIAQEMRKQEYPGWFLTLTYNEKSCPRTSGEFVMPDNGDVIQVPKLKTLRFRHVQWFFKKLRKKKYYVKYVCVGEYGSKTQRPHYHMLLWTDAGAQVIQDCWSNRDGVSRGNVHFGTLTIESAMYTLKYILQPKQRPSDGREHARAQFSRGLGLAYLTTEVYFYHSPHDGVDPVFTSWFNGHKVALPRYYRSKIFAKHQQAKESDRVYWQRLRDKREELRKYWKMGMDTQEALAYYKMLRIERANRLLENVKHTEHL